MNKYIDAEKLKKYIENKRDVVCDGLDWDDMDDSQRYAAEHIDDILDFIESLRHEQPTKGYDEAYLNECIAKASKTWKGVDADKYMDEVRGRGREQSEVDLEEEIEKYYYDNVAFISSAHTPTKDILSNIANYFYKLGLNARKEE